MSNAAIIFPDEKEVLQGMTRDELIGQIHEMYEERDILKSLVKDARGIMEQHLAHCESGVMRIWLDTYKEY